LNEDFNAKDALVLIGIVLGSSVPPKKDKVSDLFLHCISFCACEPFGDLKNCLSVGPADILVSEVGIL
jgi:hypothetical protein